MLIGTECPVCDLNTVSWVEVNQVIEYGVETDPDFTTLTVEDVPMGVCSACEFSFTDERGEILRDRRINRYLDELRERFEG